MAKAKKNNRRRNKYAGAFRVLPAFFAYANLHIITANATGLSPWQFAIAGTRYSDRQQSGFLSGSMPAGMTSAQVVTLQELLSGVQSGYSGYSSGIQATTEANPIAQMGMNLRENMIPLIMQLVGLKIAQKVVVKFGIRTSFNKLSDAVGTGSMVRA